MAAAPSGAIKWSAFVDDVLTKPELPVTVTYRAQVEVPDGGGVKQVQMTSACRIDTALMRADLEAAKFKPKDAVRPVFLEPECLPVTGPATAVGATHAKR